MEDDNSFDSENSYGDDLSDEKGEVEEKSALPKEVMASKLLAHIKKLAEKNGYEKEFEELFQKSDVFVLSDFTDALKWSNRAKNRYTNVLPLDKTRVVLSPLGDEEDSDYMNANYINGFREKEYIAAQGPLKETAGDFWRMVFEQKSNVVVMLTRLTEDQKIKCYRYWPLCKKPSKTYGIIKVTTKAKEKEGEITTREMELENVQTGQVRNIFHFQYREWPDHGLPSSASTFRHLLKLVDVFHDKQSPIIVHCSAGIGRTGTFCVVHTILEETQDFLTKQPNEDPKFNIFNTVLQMRCQRPGMVQTAEQYEFCYKAIAEEYGTFAKKRPLEDNQNGISTSNTNQTTSSNQDNTDK